MLVVSTRLNIGRSVLQYVAWAALPIGVARVTDVSNPRTWEIVRVVEAARQLIANMNAFGLEISENQICMIPKGASKHEALESLINAVGTNACVTDVEAFRAAVYEREAIQSTGLGEGIAVPHVRISEIEETTLGVGIAPHGVEFDTLDNQPVYVMVLFATPAGSTKVYLSLLAQVMLSLRDKELFGAIVKCKTAAEVDVLLNG